MNEHDLLEAIGQVSETAIHQYALPKAEHPEKKHPKAAGKEHIMMTAKQKKAKKPIRIHAGTAAAVVALCVGLNAALIFGISKLRADDSSGMTPGMQMHDVLDSDKVYMEVQMTPMPTGVEINFQNQTEETITLPKTASIWQNGQKLADAVDTAPDNNPIELPAFTTYPILYHFDELPAGNYTLITFADEGQTMSVFGSIDFEITDVFDNMVRIPDLTGENYEETISALADYPVIFQEKTIFVNDMEKGVVFDVVPETYLTEESENGTSANFYYDGSGYWVTKGSTVVVEVSSGQEATVLVPDMTNWDFEAAKETLLGLGLYVDKRMIFDDTVLEGKVISVSVTDATVDGKGLEVEVGSYVRVTVSLGANSDTVAVPNFVNLTWDEAKETADKCGLILEKNEVEDETFIGTVIAQNVTAAEEVSVETKITLDVSAGRKESVEILLSIPGGYGGKRYQFIARNSAGQMLTWARWPLADAAGTAQMSIPLLNEESEEITVYVTDPDAENDKEVKVGSYIIYRDAQTYETVSEDIGEAFRQLAT